MGLLAAQTTAAKRLTATLLRARWPMSRNSSLARTTPLAVNCHKLCNGCSAATYYVVWHIHSRRWPPSCTPLGWASQSCDKMHQCTILCTTSSCCTKSSVHPDECMLTLADLASCKQLPVVTCCAVQQLCMRAVCCTVPGMSETASTAVNQLCIDCQIRL